MDSNAFNDGFHDSEEIIASSGGLLVVCEICGSTVNRLEYERHLKTHKEKRVEICKICFKTFTNISNFKYHLAHHGTERPWLCNECPKNYKTKIDLLQHQRVHDKEKDPFRCDDCGMLFRTRSNFNTHKRTHNQVKGPQKCVLCDKMFVNLRSHIQMVHQKIRKFQCSICDKSFGKKSGLDRHTMTVHEKMRIWGCDLCSKNFGEKAQLLRHRKIHFKINTYEPDSEQGTEDKEIMDEKKRYQCGICKKTVNSRAALKRHKMLVHEKKRDFLCSQCPSAFGERSNLMRHIAKFHSTEQFVDKSGVDEEEARIDRNEIQSDNNEPFHCKFCSKVFGTKWGLQAHQDGCLLKQQMKANNRYDEDNSDDVSYEEEEEYSENELDYSSSAEDCSETHQEQNLSLMEQVFLPTEVSTEVLEIKQEPPFDDILSNPNFISNDDTESHELIDMKIKDEPREDEDLESDIKLEPFEMLDIKHEITDAAQGSPYEDSYCEEINLTTDQPQVTFAKRYKCKLCVNATFKEIRYFRSHYRTIHLKPKKLSCQYCSENFTYRAQRLRHVRLKHPETYEDTIDEPKDNKISDAECELCNRTLASQELLAQHMKAEHDDNGKAEDKSERTCSICQTIFKKIRYLILHLKAVHSEESYKCDRCFRSFSFKRSLDRHIKTIHEGIRDFKCEKNGCDKTFCNNYELQQHLIGNHDVGNKAHRTCKECFKVFKKAKYMEIHFAGVHSPQVYNCPVCNRAFSFRRSMERHVKAIHEDRRDYHCTEDGCDKSFRSRYDMNEHHNNIHAEIKKKQPLDKVTCEICDKVCSSRKVLYSHRKLVHEKVRWGINFQCKLCKEVFETKYKKTKHWSQVHRNGEIKLRKCYQCNSDFQLYVDFKKHIETNHFGCFICMICGHSLEDESALFIHNETHRKIEEDLRQFQCDKCSHRLSTKAQLQAHMRKHFSGDHYMCDICGKTYRFIAPFLYHKLVHENKFDFECRYCEKKFRMKRDRMLHERTHTGERPYKCHICLKTFSLKPNLTGHLLTHQAKIYMCKTCNSQYASAAKLRQHEDETHPELRPLFCINCRKTFKMQHSLDAHNRKCSRISFEFESTQKN